MLKVILFISLVGVPFAFDTKVLATVGMESNFNKFTVSLVEFRDTTPHESRFDKGTGLYTNNLVGALGHAGLWSCNVTSISQYPDGTISSINCKGGAMPGGGVSLLSASFSEKGSALEYKYDSIVDGTVPYIVTTSVLRYVDGSLWRKVTKREPYMWVTPNDDYTFCRYHTETVEEFYSSGEIKARTTGCVLMYSPIPNVRYYKSGVIMARRSGGKEEMFSKEGYLLLTRDSSYTKCSSEFTIGRADMNCPGEKKVLREWESDNDKVHPYYKIFIQ